MMKITLEGVAGKRFGREHQLSVRNPNEALRALCQLIPGFREFLTSAHEFGIFFQVITNNNNEVNYEGLGLGCESFSLVPVITGALNFTFRNIGLVLVGALLVAVSFGAFGITYGAAGTISAGLKSAAFALGTALIFTGIAGLFAPGIPEDGKQEGSESDDAVFRGGSGTASQGTPIPLLYGEFLCQNMPIISSYVEGTDGHILNIVSEGEIEGLATGSFGKDIYLNGLQSASSSTGDITLTTGNQNSKVITGIDSAGFHLAVGQTLQFTDDNAPNPQIIRSFNQPDADRLDIRILRGPSYQIRTSSPNDGGAASTDYRDYDAKADGFTATNFLTWNIRVIDANGGIIKDETVEDNEILKARKVYEGLKNINISGRPQPIAITLTRLDKGAVPDPKNEKGGANRYSYQWVKGDVQLVAADVMWDEKLVYPRSALLGMKFNVGEFSSMPTVQGLFKGIKVPTLDSNLRISYAFSKNPAYVLLDLLTNPRYGCGGRVYTPTGPGNPAPVSQPGINIEDIDLASFLVAANFCDEKNIEFNGYINRKSDALDLIRSVASTFQGSLIYAGGYTSVIIDRKLELADEAQFRLYSEANTIQETDDGGEVIEPCFTYEGTAKKSRTTAVEVSYVEPSEFYIERKESIEDRIAIDRFGYNQKTIRALGCTSRRQARRLGRYILGSNQLNTETVTFKVSTEGAMLLPGDICLIADPLKTRMSGGGRVVSASQNQLVTDRVLTNLPSSNLFVYTYGSTGIAQKHEVSSVSGSTITINGTFNQIPTTMQMWILATNNDRDTFRRYRVQSVKEEGDGTYVIIAILYVDRKFDYVETEDDINYGKTNRTYYKNRNPALNPKSVGFSIRNIET
tara:strand:- start:2638 stop:5211 length:2574 start_codon:yes stop_codon:yes gene_type:complete